MELYFKKVDREAKVFEIIDTAIPQYLFIFSNVDIGRTDDGRIEFACDTSVHRVDIPDAVDLTEQELDAHAEKIINSILDSFYGSERKE